MENKSFSRRMFLTVNYNRTYALMKGIMRPIKVARLFEQSQINKWAKKFFYAELDLLHLQIPCLMERS